jgi:hypothetical protein
MYYVNLKKKEKILTITTFKMNTNIRFFNGKTSIKVKEYLKKNLFF